MEKTVNNAEKTDGTLQNLIKHPVFIVWKPEYDLGIAIVDEQHRGVVTAINSLHYAKRNQQDDDVLMPVIDIVREYSRIHFKTEESFLKKCGFPDVQHHCELHGELTQTMSKAERKSLGEHDSSHFMDFLKKWWIEHICAEDRVFRDYLLKASLNV